MPSIFDLPSMLRKLLNILLIFCSLTAVASGGEVVLNLDKPIKAELLPNSQYLHDYNNKYVESSVTLLPDEQWSSFNREQFRFGLTSHPIWIKTTLTTTGSRERYVALDLHGIIDHIQLQVIDSEGQIQKFKFGKASGEDNALVPSKNYHIGKKATTDHVHVLLSPHKTYHLLLRINSNNAVIGNYRAVEPQTLDLENNTRANGVIAYLFLVFLVTFYSLIVYVTTRERAFIFHVFYVLSVTGYLLNSYGFLESWFEIEDLRLLEDLLIFCLASTLLSLTAFIKSMAKDSYDRAPKTFKALYHLFFIIGITTLCLVFLVPYTVAIRLLIVEILLAMILSPFFAFYHPHKAKSHSKLVDTKLLRLRTTLFIFTLIGGVHLCTRLGLLNVSWITNYILFFYILIEALVFAIIMFINIGNDKKALFRKTYFHRQSNLPNSRALQAHFSRRTSSTNLTLIYFWVAGFDKLEIALGRAQYQNFIATFGDKLSNDLQSNALVIPCTESGYGNLTLFHTGKNNFSILCEGLRYKDQQLLYQQINASLNHLEHQDSSNADFRVFMSADGFYPKQNNYETVTQNCLLALAQGIKSNTNIKHYDESIRTDKVLRRKLIKDFETALKSHELFLVWQPQYDVKHEKILSIEVFSRWQHPDYGLILPDVFIPLLEKSTRIRLLTKWVIKEVFATLPAIHNAIPEAEVSINLSAQDLNDSNLLDFLDAQIALNPCLAPYIVLEINESIMIDGFSIASENIKQLQLRGFKVSIENFGSGLASFSYLQTVPANELKIDKSFSDRFSEPKTYAILGNIIKLAQRLNIRLVIEGIETRQQVDLFAELGVERLQGWAISKPLLLDDLLNET